MNNLDEKKVIVGLSGGVDSAVTALLLKKQGYEVIAVTMIQFDEADFIEDAKRLSRELDIPLITVDMRDEFRNVVMADFVNEYKNGRTPNPCTLCNPKIKFKALIDAADREGAYYIATGHYAYTAKVGDRVCVCNSDNALKDQTYALCNLSQDIIKRTLFPLGKYSKEDVRKIASDNIISVSAKKDSQDICFVPGGDYCKFLENYADETKACLSKGQFVNNKGETLGTHEGIAHYTIGQRKGLNLSMGHPVFVTGIDAENNRVIIGESEDLLSSECSVRITNFMTGSDDELPKELLCKIRYAHRGTMCTLSKDGENYRVSFAEKVRAVTPGQTAVFYDNDYVFAGAVIL